MTQLEQQVVATQKTPPLEEQLLPIHVPHDEIRRFCHQNHIRKLSWFGSVLRDDFTVESDIDVLVEFEPGKTPGFAIVTMQTELSQLLDGRTVDVFLTCVHTVAPKRRLEPRSGSPFWEGVRGWVSRGSTQRQKLNITVRNLTKKGRDRPPHIGHNGEC